MKKDKWRYKLSENPEKLWDKVLNNNPEDQWIDILDGNDRTETELDVHELMEVLPDKYRSLVLDYYFNGKTLKQIGSEKGFSKQYMHQELCKALEMMRNYKA